MVERTPRCWWKARIKYHQNLKFYQFWSSNFVHLAKKIYFDCHHDILVTFLIIIKQLWKGQCHVEMCFRRSFLTILCTTTFVQWFLFTMTFVHADLKNILLCFNRIASKWRVNFPLWTVDSVRGAQNPNKNEKNWILKMLPKSVVILVLGTPEHLELGLVLQNWPFARPPKFEKYP